MIRLPSRLAGPILVQPARFPDRRGYFEETFRRDAYREIGMEADFVQDNHSRSARGTLRGLHFQHRPGQAKLVTVLKGRIQDVVVDLRRGSATFGSWESFFLDDETGQQLYVPLGFAHGFLVLTETADVIYKVSAYYDSQEEAGLAWDDPTVGVAWQVADPHLSERDRANPRLAEIKEGLPQW